MAQIEKQQFKNNTDGWVGVVVIGPKGDERGASVAPSGTVWLSEAEQILTANAPRRPEDNPFVAQKLQKTDPQTGATYEVEVTPLTLASEERFVPSEVRFVPGAADARGTAFAQNAATGDQPVTATAMELGAIAREAEVRDMGKDAQPHQAPPVPRGAALAAAAAEAAAARSSEQTAPEETASEVSPAEGEEVGAATPPVGPAPEGEYTASEEVGTPVPAQPAPYTPPQE